MRIIDGLELDLDLVLVLLHLTALRFANSLDFSHSLGHYAAET